MEKDQILQYITCPITKLIFCDPVYMDDGYTYEYMAIKHYLLTNNTSPVTGERIGNLLTRALLIKNLTNDFLQNNLEYKNDQFLFKKPYYLFTNEFLDYLKEKKYNKLTEFTSIIINTIFNGKSLIELVCNNCPPDIVKNVIDNSIDYDVYDKNKLKPLHIVARFSPPSVILHLAKKGVDIESEDNNGDRLLSYITLHKSKEEQIEIIKELLDLGVNVNVKNKSGKLAVHNIISNGNLEVLKLFIQYKLNINDACKNNDELNLLQYTFKYSPNPDLIQYLSNIVIDFDIDIVSAPMCEQLIYQNEFISKKDKRNLVLNYLTKLSNKIHINHNFIDNIIEKN